MADDFFFFFVRNSVILVGNFIANTLKVPFFESLLAWRLNGTADYPTFPFISCIFHRNEQTGIKTYVPHITSVHVYYTLTRSREQHRLLYNSRT